MTPLTVETRNTSTPTDTRTCSRHRVARHFAALATLILAAACAAPGTPKMRTSAADGGGPLIKGCQNVSRAARVEKYQTQFYLSTWASAWLEGANQGFREGLADEGGVGSVIEAVLVPPNLIAGKTYNMLPSPPDAYCRSYDAEPRAVSRAVASIMPFLENPVTVSDTARGRFETDFKRRQHKAAEWVDRYIVKVLSSGPRTTVVYIFRVLYISRDGRTFNQGLSVGHNETWIFTGISDRLRK